MAAPEKTAERETAAPRVQTSPAIATQAKVNCTDRAFSARLPCEQRWRRAGAAHLGGAAALRKNGDETGERCVIVTPMLKLRPR